MQTPIYNIEIQQAATFRRQLRWLDSSEEPVDLTGHTALMQIRRSHRHEVVLELSTANGRIVLGGAEGTVLLEVAAADTLELTPAEYVYDLLLTSAGGIATRLLEGACVVRPAVSRP